jgi:hypothetical protein
VKKNTVMASVLVAVLVGGLGYAAYEKTTDPCPGLRVRYENVANRETDATGIWEEIVNAATGQEDAEWVRLDTQREALGRQLSANGCEYDSLGYEVS